MAHYTYILLIILTLFYPLLKSFENKIQFSKKWKFLFPAILISAVVFISWDVWFVHMDIWHFNPDYILDLYIFNLPIEECLFFLVVPFSSVFIYEVMNYFIKKDILKKQEKHISNLLAITLLLVSMIYHQKLHTFITFFSFGVFLFIHQYVFKSNYLGRYYIAWLVCLVPFLILDGVLTVMPVSIYNSSEIIGLHIFTIPVEDVIYGMLQFLVVITIYESLRSAYDKTSADKIKSYQ